MTENEKLKKLLDLVSKEEDKYSDLSLKAMDEGKFNEMQMYQGAAAQCMKLRFTIEDML